MLKKVILLLSYTTNKTICLINDSFLMLIVNEKSFSSNLKHSSIKS